LRQFQEIATHTKVRHHRAANQPQTNRPNDYDSANLKFPEVLLVDDDPDLHTSLTIQLKRFAIVLRHAYFGQQAISESLQRIPDLVVTDLAMPTGTGQLVIECLKNYPETSNVPILVMSGMRRNEIQRKATQAGAAGFLRKPASFDNFIYRVGRFIEVQEIHEGGS